MNTSVLGTWVLQGDRTMQRRVKKSALWAPLMPLLLLLLLVVVVKKKLMANSKRLFNYFSAMFWQNVAIQWTQEINHSFQLWHPPKSNLKEQCQTITVNLTVMCLPNNIYRTTKSALFFFNLFSVLIKDNHFSCLNIYIFTGVKKNLQSFNDKDVVPLLFQAK